MKHILLIGTLFVSAFSIAQKTDKTKIDFEVEMLPLELVSKEKKFDVAVDYDYRGKAEAATSETAEKKEQAAKEKAEYDKKNYGEKLLATKVMGEAKPTGYYNSNAFVPTIFPEEGVKSQISIPGYVKLNGANGRVSAIFSELTYTIDAAKTKITYYPLAVNLTITNDKGVTVFQGALPNNNASLTYSSSTSNEVQRSLLPTLKGCETVAKNNTMINLNNYLKNNYGFNTLKNDRTFFDVKDKKQTYPECHEAIEKVKIAFMNLNVAAKQEVVVAKLKEAITIWEKSLTEIDKVNKDARINKDVAAALYLNIAEACIWIKDFDKAYESLASHKALDEDYSRSYKDISEFLKDYSKRYNKYTQY